MLAFRFRFGASLALTVAAAGAAADCGRTGLVTGRTRTGVGGTAIGSTTPGAAQGGAVATAAVAATGGGTVIGGNNAAGGATATGAIPAAGGTVTTGGSLLTGSGGATVACAVDIPSSPDSLIDNMESGTGRILDNGGRVGVWYAFNDADSGPYANASQWPAPTTPGVPIPTSSIPGGRGCSTRAIRTYGGGFVRWGAGVGFDLWFDGQHYRTYDASAYDGITFWARGNLDIQARISTAATTRVEWGGTCPQEPCTFPYHETLGLGSDWAEYWVPFAFLHSMDWPIPVKFEPTQLTNIQFLSPGPAQCDSWTCSDIQSFDYWIDDVSFYQGHPPCCAALPASCQSLSHLADDSLDRAVRSVAGNLAGDFTCADLCAITSLEAAPAGLDGIQCLPNLRSLFINTPDSIDLTHLADLTQLAVLTLFSRYSDISPLARLTRLTKLIATGNRIGDVHPLASLSQLTTLQLANNNINDVSPLAGLSQLTTLSLGNNQITDIGPLGNLVQLRSLDLSANQVTDLSPLLALPHLESLNVWQNPFVCETQRPILQTLSASNVHLGATNCGTWR